jgi:hypothetical protein
VVEIALSVDINGWFQSASSQFESTDGEVVADRAQHMDAPWQPYVIDAPTPARTRPRVHSHPSPLLSSLPYLSLSPFSSPIDAAVTEHYHHCNSSLPPHPAPIHHHHSTTKASSSAPMRSIFDCCKVARAATSSSPPRTPWPRA